MAYEPTTWECGDVVTAELLNKIENELSTLSEAIENMSGGGVRFIDSTDLGTPSSNGLSSNVVLVNNGATDHEETVCFLYDFSDMDTDPYLMCVSELGTTIRLVGVGYFKAPLDAPNKTEAADGTHLALAEDTTALLVAFLNASDLETYNLVCLFPTDTQFIRYNPT